MPSKELRQVKQMIRGLGRFILSTYSQTLNGRVACQDYSFDETQILAPSGPLLVSRTGDVG